MLQAFSDRIRNSRWLGYTIVALIVVPFALWGVQSYFAGGDTQDVAEVEGTSISEADLDRRLSQRREEIRRDNDGSMPDDLDGDALRRQVLDEMIEQELMATVAADYGLYIGDQQVSQYIRNQEFFQSNGEFDRNRYQQILARSGLQPQDYEADVRRSLRVEQVRGGLMASGFVLPGEAEHIATLEGQERRASVVRVDRDRVAEEIEISDDDLRAFYDDNTDRFQTERKVRLAYVELDLDRMAEQVTVTDEDMRAEYERRVGELEEEERRRAEHILLEVDEDADDGAWDDARERLEELRNRAREGDDFSDLAESHSDDVGSADEGGDLGWIERGDMSDAFDEALFGLAEEGDISEPVRTRFGYHLIRLVEREGEEAPSFESMEDEIRSDLRRRQAEEDFFDRVDDMANSAFENPGSLEPVAETADGEVEESDWLSREAGEGIAEHEAVREAAFSEGMLEERSNSDVIEIGDRHAAVIRVIDEREPEAVPFDEARDEIRDEMRQERITQRSREILDEVRTALDEGTALEEVAGDDAEMPIRVDGPVTLRLREETQDLSRAVIETAFELSPSEEGGASVGEVDGDGGDPPQLVVVHDIRYAEPAQDRIAQIEFALQSMQSRSEMEAWLSAVRAAADVTINEDNLRRDGERSD